MKIDFLGVKLRFVDSKVSGKQRPDVSQQEAILKHINTAMEEFGAHIVDIDVSASIEDSK